MGEKQKNPKTSSSEMGSEDSMCGPTVIPYLLGSTGAGKRQSSLGRGQCWHRGAGPPGWGRGGSSPACIPLKQLRSHSPSLGNVPQIKWDVWKWRSVPWSCCIALNHTLLCPPYTSRWHFSPWQHSAALLGLTTASPCICTGGNTARIVQIIWHLWLQHHSHNCLVSAISWGPD